MTGKWHRAITLVAGVVGLVGGIVVITDPSTLGVSPETWKYVGGWLAFGGSLTSGFATLIRANALPGMTTGVGNESAVATTTTVSVKETTP